MRISPWPSVSWPASTRSSARGRRSCWADTADLVISRDFPGGVVFDGVWAAADKVERNQLAALVFQGCMSWAAQRAGDWRCLRPVLSGRWLLVAVLVAQLSGLVWVGLLGVSKVIQTARNAQRSGFQVALSRIPKGKGNCGMCQKTSQTQAQQTQQQLGAASTVPGPFVLLAMLPATGSALRRPVARSHPPVVLLSWHTVNQAPPEAPHRKGVGSTQVPPLNRRFLPFTRQVKHAVQFKSFATSIVSRLFSGQLRLIG